MDGVNERQIAIIAGCNSSEGAEALCAELGRLVVPTEYTVGVYIYTTQQTSLAALYNIGMREAATDTSVFILEGTRLGSAHILEDIVAAFAADDSIGMVGAVGARELPTSGNIFETYGAIDGGAFTEPFAEVQALQPGLVAVRGAARWREDIFSGADFIVESLCVEELRAGKKVAVARQSEPWALAVPDIELTEPARNAFLDEYSRDIYPLVTVAIPTYNRPEYFRQALDSVLAQTYRNIEVFITDNSPSTATKELMQEYLACDSRIIYEHHPEFDEGGNWERLWAYDNPAAEYLNLLMDDDLFMPTKLEVMVQAYRDNPGVTLVTSNRYCIDGTGEVIEPPEGLFQTEETQCLLGSFVGKTILTKQRNFIGEPTTVLVRKCYLEDGYYGWDRVPDRYRISDFPTWLGLVTRGNVLFLAERLSGYRIHPGQEQNRPDLMVRGAVCWLLELYHAGEERVFFDSPAEYREVVLSYAKGTLGVVIDTVQEGHYDSDWQRLYEETGRLLALVGEPHE